MQAPSLNPRLLQIMRTARITNADRWPILASLAKLTEEVGETSEATLVELGFMRKDLKEGITGEAADVIICLLDILARVRSYQSPEELLTELDAELHRKSLKWYEKGIFRGNPALA